MIYLIEIINYMAWAFLWLLSYCLVIGVGVLWGRNIARKEARKTQEQINKIEVVDPEILDDAGYPLW